MKIFLTGGTGILGKELVKLLNTAHKTLYAPTSREVDITNETGLKSSVAIFKPDILIHCAAYTNVIKAETSFMKCIETNIIGTANVVKACEQTGSKLIYISTEHVFDGEKGDYKTTDYINPITKYAKSKAAGELIARMYDNSLIIRTSFYPHYFPYEKAFVDQWSTKDYIDIIAPKILNLCLSDKRGIVHCGSKKRTIFEIAKTRKADIIPFSRKDIQFPTLKDTSLLIEEESDGYQ